MSNLKFTNLHNIKTINVASSFKNLLNIIIYSQKQQIHILLLYYLLRFTYIANK